MLSLSCLFFLCFEENPSANRRKRVRACQGYVPTGRVF
jgi:hypothetical protein